MDIDRLGPVEYQGPVQKRKLRDWPFLVLFILFWFGTAFVAWQAFSAGDPRYLLYTYPCCCFTLIFTSSCRYPQDTDGQFCGIPNADGFDFTQRKYLYFLDPFNETAPQVCLSECPKTTAIPSTVSTTVCKSRNVSSTSELISAWSTNECSRFTYASKSLLYRCVPTDIQELLTMNISTVNVNQTALQSVIDSQDMASKVVGDFVRTWPWFLVFAGVSVIISLLWIFLIRFHAGFFVWTTVFLVLFCVNGMVVFFYFTWDAAKTRASGQFVSEGMQREEQTYFGMLIASACIAGIIDLLLLFMRKRLKIAISILKEASRAVSAMPSMVLFPILIFLLTLILFSFWVAAELYLASARKVPELIAPTTNLTVFKYFQWYLLFALFWGQQFLSGVNQTTLAGAVVTWYWAIDKRSLPGMPVWRSFGRVLKYHLGSIALGSLLIAVIQFIRALIYAAQRQLRRVEGDNRWAKCILTTCQCCCACFESVMMFINRNAYIEIAMYGKPFCTSAKNAFQLLVRNAFRLVAIDFVSSLILLLSKIIVTSVSGVGSYYALKYYYADDPLYYTSPTVFVIMVESFVVTSLFLYVYDMTIDATFLAFCEDCERNDGTPEKPYRMSRRLQALADIQKVPMRMNKVQPTPNDIIRTRQAYIDEL